MSWLPEDLGSYVPRIGTAVIYDADPSIAVRRPNCKGMIVANGEEYRTINRKKNECPTSNCSYGLFGCQQDKSKPMLLSTTEGVNTLNDVEQMYFLRHGDPRAASLIRKKNNNKPLNAKFYNKPVNARPNNKPLNARPKIKPLNAKSNNKPLNAKPKNKPLNARANNNNVFENAKSEFENNNVFYDASDRPLALANGRFPDKRHDAYIRSSWIPQVQRAHDRKGLNVVRATRNANKILPPKRHGAHFFSSRPSLVSKVFGVHSRKALNEARSARNAKNAKNAMQKRKNVQAARLARSQYYSAPAAASGGNVAKALASANRSRTDPNRNKTPFEQYKGPVSFGMGALAAAKQRRLNDEKQRATYAFVQEREPTIKRICRRKMFGGGMLFGGEDRACYKRTKNAMESSWARLGTANEHAEYLDRMKRARSFKDL